MGGRERERGGRKEREKRREERGRRDEKEKGGTETLKANTLMVHSSHPLAKAFIPIFLPMSPTSTPG